MVASTRISNYSYVTAAPTTHHRAPTMKPTIALRHTTDRHGAPLAIVYDFPGLYAEMRPAELRRLAMALAQAANDCEARAARKQNSTTTPVQYQIADEVTA